jgi:precorrin-2/cobalt-factor-2 C20-methyltransferase
MDCPFYQWKTTMNEQGTFYGIGVGPGDPELITVKAKNVLERMRSIFTPVAGQDRESIAYSIARRYISPDARIERLIFPMTADRTVCESAWEENARTIARVLEKGADAAFITLGDPMTYSTYGYLLKKMETLYPAIRSVTIPGIPSYLAGAASANITLTEGMDIMTIIPGAVPEARIRAFLGSSDTVVLLKHNSNTLAIRALLQEMGLQDRATYVRRLGFPGETITKDGEQDLADRGEYLSLIIVKKK